MKAVLSASLHWMEACAIQNVGNCIPWRCEHASELCPSWCRPDASSDTNKMGHSQSATNWVVSVDCCASMAPVRSSVQEPGVHELSTAGACNSSTKCQVQFILLTIKLESQCDTCTATFMQTQHVLVKACKLGLVQLLQHGHAEAGWLADTSADGGMKCLQSSGIQVWGCFDLEHGQLLLQLLDLLAQQYGVPAGVLIHHRLHIRQQ